MWFNERFGSNNHMRQTVYIVASNNFSLYMCFCVCTSFNSFPPGQHNYNFVNENLLISVLFHWIFSLVCDWCGQVRFRLLLCTKQVTSYCLNQRWPSSVKHIWWGDELVELIHWNGKGFILMKFSSLAALEVVILTTSSAANDENFVKMTTFSFQWYMNFTGFLE